MTDMQGEITYDSQATKALRLEYLTVTWNCLEGMIAVTAGIVAGSIALVGFGVDSVIEVSSGVIMLWRLSYRGSRQELVEARALRLVGLSLLALAGYVGLDAAYSLISREAPRSSYVGIGLAIASLIVMPILARSKRQVAAKLQSKALHADSRQTDICAYLSAILLVGLVSNAFLGWWWTDPVAALAMVPIIVKEGREALRGETCCDTCH